MKHLSLCLAYLLVVHSLPGQKKKNFEGRILYENTFESHISSLSNDLLSTMMGSQWDYFISRDRYKFEMNGQHIEKQYYDPEELKLYTKYHGLDTLVWIDVREWNTEIVNFEMVKTDEVILGHKCNALVLKTDKGKETYYFSKFIKADPENFNKHKFLNMAFVLKHTGSIPLKIVLENEEMDLVSTAIEIESIDFPPNLFDVPDLPSKPSDY